MHCTIMQMTQTLCANAGKHERARAVCVNKGQRLCKWDEICVGADAPGQSILDK